MYIELIRINLPENVLVPQVNSGKIQVRETYSFFHFSHNITITNTKLIILYTKVKIDNLCGVYRSKVAPVTEGRRFIFFWWVAEKIDLRKSGIKKEHNIDNGSEKMRKPWKKMRKIEETKVEVTEVMSLPEETELMLLIFSYIQPVDLLRTIRLVCQRWKDLAEDDPTVCLAKDLRESSFFSSWYVF